MNVPVELDRLATAVAFGERRISEIGVFDNDVCWLERDPTHGNYPVLVSLSGNEMPDVIAESALYGYRGRQLVGTR